MIENRESPNRTYSQEERAEAIGLALSVGVNRAGEQLGIPHRTISNWMVRPEAVALVARSERDVAARLWEAVDVGTEAVLAGLRDPSARLSDKAAALRVVAEQWQLLSGRATARTETSTSMAFEEREALRVFTDQLERMLDSGDTEGAMRTALQLQAAERVAVRGLESGLDDADVRQQIVETIEGMTPDA